MRIVAVSDLHGELEPVHRALSVYRPDLILSCGDWGDADRSDRAGASSAHPPCAGVYDLWQSRPARTARRAWKIAMVRRS